MSPRPACATYAALLLALLPGPAISVEPAKRTAEQGAYLTGTLTNEEGNTWSGDVLVYAENGGRVATIRAYPHFLSPPLAPGRYRIVAVAPGFLPTAFPATACAQLAGCWASSPVIELELDGHFADVSVRLRRPPRGAVRVRATDAGTQGVLEPVSFGVELLPRGSFFPYFLRDGKVEPGVTCIVEANLDRLCLVPLGSSYRVHVHAWSYGDIRWPDIPCEEGCPADAGALVAPAADTVAEVEVSMQRFGWLEGALQVDAPHILYDYQIELFHESGAPARRLAVFTWFEPPERTPGYFGEVAPGRYFARTQNDQGFVDQLHDRIPCPDGRCDPTLGIPVEIEPHRTTRLDFDLGGQDRMFRGGFE